MNLAATADPRLREAYRHCRVIARQRARNFYYAFVALPAHKRDAICAVYAFMRRADDIADEPSEAVPQRRVAMQQWLAAWKLAEAGGPTSDLTFIALRDAQQRFKIPAQLLDHLVQGTTIDLDEHVPVYETFEQLYRYCYLVASVVGLVCIRIFGYDDPRAEQLAEETGVAFQLTNILRDVPEDAAMGRVYLTGDLLRDAGLKPGELLAEMTGESVDRLKQAMKVLAQRADSYYKSAGDLLPLIHADSRPALWVLVTIYRRLLRRIQSSEFDVFSARIEVPPSEKLAILAQGIGKVLLRKLLISRS